MTIHQLQRHMLQFRQCHGCVVREDGTLLVCRSVAGKPIWDTIQATEHAVAAWLTAHS